MTFLRYGFAAVSLALVAGCAVGPDFVAPATPTPSNYTAAPVAVVTSGTDVPAMWWESAQAALKVARENAEAQRGAFFPQVSATTASSRQSSSTTLSSPLTDNRYIFNLHTAQLNIAYTPDVFGGNRRQFESLQAQTELQQLQVEATYLTLASNVVAAAIQDALLRQQIATTRALVVSLLPDFYSGKNANLSPIFPGGRATTSVTDTNNRKGPKT